MTFRTEGLGSFGLSFGTETGSYKKYQIHWFECILNLKCLRVVLKKIQARLMVTRYRNKTNRENESKAVLQAG